MSREDPAPRGLTSASGENEKRLEENEKQILRARAKALARARNTEESNRPVLHVVEFRLARERYGVECSYVREVHRFEEFTPLPGVPSFILGIVNIRGQILALMDLKRFFNLPAETVTELQRIVVVKSFDLEVGILVDSIVGTRTIPIDCIQEPPATFEGMRHKFVRGLDAGALVILDLAKMVADPELRFTM